MESMLSLVERKKYSLGKESEDAKAYLRSTLKGGCDLTLIAGLTHRLLRVDAQLVMLREVEEWISDYAQLENLNKIPEVPGTPKSPARTASKNFREDEDTKA